MNTKRNSLTAFKKPSERILPAEPAPGPEKVGQGAPLPIPEVKRPKPIAVPSSIISHRLPTSFVDRLDEVFSEEKIKRRKAGDRGFKKVAMAEEAYQLWLDKYGYER